MTGIFPQLPEVLGIESLQFLYYDEVSNPTVLAQVPDALCSGTQRLPDKTTIPDYTIA